MESKYPDGNAVADAGAPSDYEDEDAKADDPLSRTSSDAAAASRVNRTPSRFSAGSSSLRTFDAESYKKLMELSDDVRHLAQHEKNESISGANELALRMEKLKNALQDNVQYAEQLSHNRHVEKALADTHKTLIVTKEMLIKSKETRWRRNAKYKEQVRTRVNDACNCVHYLNQALLLAQQEEVSMGGFGSAPAPMTDTPPKSSGNSKQGQVQCTLADQALFGRGRAQDFGLAFRLYSAAAAAGYTPAMISLAQMLLKGQGTPRRPEQALSALQSAAERGNVAAMQELGELLSSGDEPGIPKDEVRALEFFQKAAEKGFAPAQASMGAIYEQGLCDVVEDLDVALTFYKKAIAQGNARAMNNYGYLFYTGAAVDNGEPDFTQAFAWFTKAAEKSHAPALFNLGVCWEAGRGCARNESNALLCYSRAAAQGHSGALSSCGYMYLRQGHYQKAAEVLRRAAESGNPEGLYYLATMYKAGVHVRQDMTASFVYFSQAAAKGHALSHLEVGHCYFFGAGVERDNVQAFAHYKAAADSKEGSSEAENRMGVCMEEGLGTIQDFDQAHYWYERAAKKGNADALHNLATLYECGRGVDRDTTHAEELYREAAKLGSAQAKMRLAEIELRRRNKEVTRGVVLPGTKEYELLGL